MFNQIQQKQLPVYTNAVVAHRIIQCRRFLLHLPGNSVIHNLKWLSGFLVAFPFELNVAIVDKLEVFRVIHYPIPKMIFLLKGRVICGHINNQEHPGRRIFQPCPVTPAPCKGMFNPRHNLFILLFGVIVVFRVCVPIRNVTVLFQFQAIKYWEAEFITEICPLPVTAQNFSGKLGFRL